jgi:hypothetical protein
MPRARIVALLAILEERIGLAEASIDCQRRAIEQMRKKRRATGTAETNLTIAQVNLAVHLAERERLRADLAALPWP